MAAWLIVLGVIVLAIAYVFYNYFRIRRMGEGTAEMIEMAEIIRSGAATFLKTEYRTISIVVLLVALVFSLFIEKTSGITFLKRGLHVLRRVRAGHAQRHLCQCAHG